MERERDPQYLQAEQYVDASNLEHRANLHRKYGTAATSILAWMVDHIPWPLEAEVLDVGCGPGWLWRELATKSPDTANNTTLTLTDLSKGMVDEAITGLTTMRAYRSTRGLAVPADDLPFATASFNVVTALHMMYHVPDVARALNELCRVLEPNGTLIISTNGPGHLHEIEETITAVFGAKAVFDVNETFAPATAAPLLYERFSDVRWMRFEDTLACTDSNDVINAILSTPNVEDPSDAQIGRMRSIVENRMQANGGVFKVAKHTGMFLCRAPRSLSIGTNGS
jgi:ubiquinone/menaquinone biosynthesis C-methylase UbiE